MVLFQCSNTGIDLLFGGFGAEAEANHTAGNLFGKLQRCNDMAGLTLMAGGTGGNADALSGKIVDNVLAGPADQRNGEDMRCGSVGNQLQIGDLRELCCSVSFNLCHMSQFFGQALKTQFHGLGKTGDLSCSFRAAAQAVFLAAAGEQRLRV